MMLRFRGFTLIELLIAVTIFAFLLMLAGPMYAEFMANSQIRNAADAMLNGVQRTQATAIRGNTLVRLVLDTTPGTGGWRILETVDGVEPAGAPNPIQTYTVLDGAPKTTVTTIPGAARQLTFDGLGRLVNPNVDASAPLRCIKVTHPNGTRPLNVAISDIALNVGTKMCDPNVVATEPQGCPAGCN